MGQFTSQLRMATVSGLKSKDDCIDTISMLAYLKPWKPSDSVPATPEEIDRWEDMHPSTDESALASYIV